MTNFEGIQNYTDQLQHEREESIGNFLSVAIAYLVGNWLSNRRGSR